MFDRESNANKTSAQESNKYRVPAWPSAIQRKPDPRAASPDSPTPETNGWLPDFNTLDPTQRDMLVPTERKIVAVENHLLIRNLNKTIFI